MFLKWKIQGRPSLLIYFIGIPSLYWRVNLIWAILHIIQSSQIGFKRLIMSNGLDIQAKQDTIMEVNSLQTCNQLTIIFFSLSRTPELVTNMIMILRFPKLRFPFYNNTKGVYDKRLEFWNNRHRQETEL